LRLVSRLLQFLAKHWQSHSAIVLTAITVFSLIPLPELPEIPGSDKTHHLIAYACLMLPAALRRPKYLWAIALFFITWSGLIELIQPYVNRYGEWVDLLANTVGVAIGVLLGGLLNLVLRDRENQ